MMKEDNVITLANGGRYLLLHNLGDVDGKNYFYAVGMSPDNEIEADDNLFFEVTENDGNTIVVKVDESSDTYKKLLTIELVDSTLENFPNFADKVEEFIKTMDAKESSE